MPQIFFLIHADLLIRPLKTAGRSRFKCFYEPCTFAIVSHRILDAPHPSEATAENKILAPRLARFGFGLQKNAGCRIMLCSVPSGAPLGVRRALKPRLNPARHFSNESGGIECAGR
jgi:hypothetical protein